MSNIAKLEFPALECTGENYMTWTANAKRHLKSKGVLDTINEGNTCEEKDKATADVFLHKHIDNMLQIEYSNCDDPHTLWNDLKNRFDHQKEVLLPAARNEWNNLRLQDFKRVNEYTSALFRITSTLQFCGHPVTEADMLEKTFSTFHASNIVLQQHYRLQNFKKYSELNVSLIVAEKNSELILKNHQARPTGSLTIPEAHVVNKNDIKPSERRWERNHGQGRGRGRGRGHFNRNHSHNHNHSFKGNNNYRGRGRGRGRGHGHNQRNNTYHAPQMGNFNEQNKLKNEASTSQNRGDSCHRCGMMNHWSKACRTPEHLCRLYQTSLKGKEKEVNHVGTFENLDIELNNSDFLNDYEA
ncbi:hypothetical protein SSX86_016835 [Deinandra increscens subsp. villosa]|uniref:CCHC-type domain-containing protein n=1 Tax=Deinandra increscens subsp. villosa TaxID=3103831 RepID=A0AAP0CY31_9ASTR